MKLNNGEIFDYTQVKVLTEFSKCIYFFKNICKTNYIKVTYKRQNILGIKLSEENEKIDLIIQIPKDFECCHYYKSKITQQIKSTSKTHLTYHGSSKKKKQSGEIHLVVNDVKILKRRSNVLEAPVAYSDDVSKFPLPICRLELTENIPSIILTEKIENYFEIFGEQCFYNTMDIYVAKFGFSMNSLTSLLTIPKIALSIFTYTTLEGFETGKIIPRRGRYPQVIVLQTIDYEVIIVNIQEDQNQAYSYNRLLYFHSRNYLKTLFNRYAKEVNAGYFIDLEDGYPDKGPGYFKIIDKM